MLGLEIVVRRQGFGPCTRRSRDSDAGKVRSSSVMKSNVQAGFPW